MAQSVSPPTTTQTFCARHRDMPTLLRCVRCGTPICPRCMINTEVGQRCPDCAQAKRLPTFQVSPILLARGAAAGLLVATVIAFVWGSVPAFSFWIGLLMGFSTGEAVARASNVRRGPAMMATAAAAVLIGFLIGYIGIRRGLGGVLTILVNPLLLMQLGIFTLIALGLAIVIAAVRQRG